MFMGAGRMPDKNLFLVLEYMELGGMDELIESHEKDRALSWTVCSLILFFVMRKSIFTHTSSSTGTYTTDHGYSGRNEISSRRT